MQRRRPATDHTRRLLCNENTLLLDDPIACDAPEDTSLLPWSMAADAIKARTQDSSVLSLATNVHCRWTPTEAASDALPPPDAAHPLSHSGSAGPRALHTTPSIFSTYTQKHVNREIDVLPYRHPDDLDADAPPTSCCK